MDSKTRGFRLALCQFSPSLKKPDSIATALQNIKTAVQEKGAKVVALPECFIFPYGSPIKDFIEEVPSGSTSQFLSNTAREFNIYLVGGTIPEFDPKDGKIYNTCTIWGPDGALLGTYRKMHMIDINIPGLTYQESSIFTPGNKLTVVEIENCKVGFGICHDVRFGEIHKLYREQGCDLILIPGSFNIVTGPRHWELFARSRAADNQIFVGMISPSRDTSAGWVAYGHSMIIDPWGQVMQSAGEMDEIVVQDIDCKELDALRVQLPVSSQSRRDLYQTVIKDPTLFDKY